jgi:hypothetical protein
MTIARQRTKPSTLIDILKQAKDALDAMGRFMPTSIGKAYLAEGAGSSPRVVFVPESGNGRVESPQEMGHAAKIVHTCTVHVRGRESGDDVERFREAYDLADLVIDLVQTAGTGRIIWGEYSDGSPTDTDAGYGVEIVIGFSYWRDLRHDATRWGLPAAADDTDAAFPQPPPGTPAGGITITPTTEPQPPGGGDWP